MRMMASRYALPKPATMKRGGIAAVKHIGAPLKGLSLSSKLVTGDPLSATVLDNFVIEENLIRARAGIQLRYHDASAQPVETLIPYYGAPEVLAAAIGGRVQLALTGGLIQGGFGGNDWSVTAFSDLSETDYTVMVNGVDGVWSWNGGSATGIDPGPIAVTSLSNSNPAVCTVAPTDIAKFQSGMSVLIAGADAAHTAANGAHVISLVGSPANTFTLAGINTSTAPGPQLGGVTADPPAPTPMVKEVVTAAPADPWITVDRMNIVVSHMNRLFFADNSNLAVFYLPIQQKSGQLKALPLNALFKRGGTIRALATWTIDGGMGLDDQLVIFTSNGEAAIYGGVDPDTDFVLRGVYRFDAPMSKHCVVNYGGELYVLISTGLVPMSTMLRAESDQLGQSDRNVFSLFSENALFYRSRPGWQAMLNPSSGRLICSMPLGSPNNYQQAVRFMPNPYWATWSRLPSRCWAWMSARMFIGSDDGSVYEMHPTYLNDAGKPIYVDVQAAWGNFGSAAQKQFKMVLAYLQTDGYVRPLIDMRVDYDDTGPVNWPDAAPADPGSQWNIADWNTASWAQGVKPVNNWTGVTGHGRVGAPRLAASVLNCQFMLTGWDVLYESGSVFG